MYTTNEAESTPELARAIDKLFRAHRENDPLMKQQELANIAFWNDLARLGRYQARIEDERD